MDTPRSARVRLGVPLPSDDGFFTRLFNSACGTARPHGPEERALTAEVSVDGGAPIALAVDAPNKRVTGRIENIPPGRHTFTITYWINGIVVAIWSADAEVKLGETTSLVIDAGSFNIPMRMATASQTLRRLRREQTPRTITLHRRTTLWQRPTDSAKEVV